MKSTKIIILCAGDGSRWGEYMGVPKQLISIGGESLLERTVRLLHSQNYKDITVISHDERLCVEGCTLHRPIKNQWIVETLLSTQALWSDRTIVLLGDVFFTEDALVKVLRSNEQTHFYGRESGSKYTFTPWGEIFALSFEKEGHVQLVDNARKVISDAKAGGRGKLWELYRSMAGFPLNKHRVEREIFVSINDFTDDFDFPEDYMNNIRRYDYLTSASWKKRIVVKVWMKYMDFRFFAKGIQTLGMRFLDRNAKEVG